MKWNINTEWIQDMINNINEQYYDEIYINEIEYSYGINKKCNIQFNINYHQWHV